MLLPQQAWAYSYGDPSQEVIAEALKEFQAKLSGDSPDWTGVGKVYKVHRAEIESHFGTAVAVTFDVNIAAKDKDLFLANYKALLVMNLERRFDYAHKGINDYSQAKLLLAKAKGTYDVLQPYVKSDVDTAVMAAFDAALEALGNPGLFGVGEKPVDPETFKQQTTLILEKIKPLFPYKESKPAPVKQEPAKTAPAKDQTSTETQQKPAESTAKPAEPSNKPEASPAKPEKETGTAVESPKPEVTEAETNETEPAETVEAEAEAGQTETVQQEEQPIEPTESVESIDSPNEETALETEVETEPAATVESATQHAPMERSNRTNPIVSVVVIGAVVLAAAGGIWYAKKQKLF